MLEDKKLQEAFTRGFRAGLARGYAMHRPGYAGDSVVSDAEIAQLAEVDTLLEHSRVLEQISPNPLPQSPHTGVRVP